MRRESLAEKKRTKGFYMRGFHYSVNGLMISVVLNLVLIIVIHNKLLHPGESTFYASNGFTPTPIKLAPLDAPNQSSIPLLPNDPPEEMTIRALPENV